MVDALVFELTPVDYSIIQMRYPVSWLERPVQVRHYEPWSNGSVRFDFKTKRYKLLGILHDKRLVYAREHSFLALWHVRTHLHFDALLEAARCGVDLPTQEYQQALWERGQGIGSRPWEELTRHTTPDFLTRTVAFYYEGIGVKLF